MKDLAGILVFVVPACWLMWVSVRVFRSPEEPLVRGRWWVFGEPILEGERQPTPTELRLWAIVWFVIAVALLAFGLAFGLTR